MDLKTLLFLKTSAYRRKIWHFSEDELDIGYISSDGVWHRTTSNNQVSTVGYLDHSVRKLESDEDHYFSLYRFDPEFVFVDRIVNLRSYAEFDFDQYEYRFVLKRNDGSYFEKAEAVLSLAYEK